MKSQRFIWIICLLVLFLGYACKKTPGDPGDGNNNGNSNGNQDIVYGDTATANVKMPQFDISWPSLADSPWPLAKRTPQCMARTPYLAPRDGEIEWEASTPGHKQLCPPVIGEDGTIYVTLEGGLSDKPGGLYAVDQNGSVKWHFGVQHELEKFEGSCAISADGTIYVGTWGTEGLGFMYALNPDSTVKWTLDLGSESLEEGNNMGIDGTLYTVTRDGKLHAISQEGESIWTVSGSGGFYSGGSIALSPDGSTLYVEGLDLTLNAVSTTDGSVIWQLPLGSQFNQGIMVDNQGNVYFNIQDSTSASFSCIDPSGNIKWRYITIMQDCVMDWDGYIYIFSYYTLHALDYEGQFRWKRNFNSYSDWTPVLCDGENIVFIQTRLGTIYGINQSGDIILEIDIIENTTDMGAIGAQGNLYCSKGIPVSGYDCFLVAIK